MTTDTKTGNELDLAHESESASFYLSNPISSEDVRTLLWGKAAADDSLLG